MKQTASILLLAILSFNWIGYQFISSYMENKSDVVLESRIDNSDYDESRLIELRVPLNTPYLSDTREFERCDGELEIKGVHYKYVKRRIENGELVLLCLPNDSKTRFQNSRIDFFKLVNDLGHSAEGKQKSSSASFKSFITEYSEENNSWTLTGPVLLTLQHIITGKFLPASEYTYTPVQPPRLQA